MNDINKKETGKGLVLMILLMGLMSVILISKIGIETVYVGNIPLDDYGVEVSVQDYTGDSISFFMTNKLQETTLTSDLIASDSTAEVVDSTGCVVGDALDLYDDNYYFQSIIREVVGNTITFTPPSDYNFNSSNTVVVCGEWNLNVDGSVNPVNYTINPPLNRSWDIKSMGMQFTDNSDWDINTFGSRSSLTNGFVFSKGDGIKKELFLIYDNGGFALRGATITNFEKAPSGKYGFNVDLNLMYVYGAFIMLDGSDNQELIATVRDDLTNQDEIAITIRGHYRDE